MNGKTLKKNKKLLIVIIVMVFITIVSISYAFLSIGGKQSLSNTFKSGCLNITINNETNAISLNEAYPITDVEGLETKGYTFTINNTCSTSSDYVINLENINEQANTLSSDYLKVALNSDNFDNIITKLSNNESTTPALSDAYEAYTIYKGSIEGNTTKIFELREWLDYDATKEHAANKTITNKINVIAASNIEVDEKPVVKTSITDKTLTGIISGSAGSAKYCITSDSVCTPVTETTIANNTTTIELKGYKKKIVCIGLDNSRTMCSEPIEREQDYLATIKAGSVTSTSPFLEGNINREQIKSITTLDDVVIPEGATSWDVSEKQNGSIVAWYEEVDNDGLYDVYIGQEEGVKANSNSAFLFMNMKNVTSMDLSKFDTSEVIDMQSMFYNVSILTNLDLSSFDTSNVTNMSAMFWGMKKLSDFNLSSFRTTKVKRMDQMFNNLSSLTSLDLRNFDTSNVTNMSGMFYMTRTLTSLNLNSFNTSNVTNMSGMFAGVGAANLSLRNFDTSNVKTMDSMFYSTKLIYLDISSFNTSNVTNMTNMFASSNKIINLDLSNFDTSNVTLMNKMFAETFRLKSLDLRNANFSKVTDYGDMLYFMTDLTSITVKDSDAEAFINSRLSDVGKTANVIIAN